VRRIAVPAPGGPEELADLAGDIVSRPLDRDRPLWELWIVEGLRDGHIAVVAKMHHSTVDGVSGANLMMYLFDLKAEPDDVAPAPEDWAPEHKPSEVELLAYAARSWMKRPWQAARIIPGTVRAATSMVRLRRSDDRSAGALPLTGPRTSFNHPLTAHRNIAFLSIPLDDIKSIKHSFGCTVNDVVLAVCTGALRQYLAEGGELPEKSLVATCPVSVRTEENEAEVGTNRVSAMFVGLPVHVRDERLRALTAGETATVVDDRAPAPAQLCRGRAPERGRAAGAVDAEDRLAGTVLFVVERDAVGADLGHAPQCAPQAGGAHRANAPSGLSRGGGAPLRTRRRPRATRRRACGTGSPRGARRSSARRPGARPLGGSSCRERRAGAPRPRGR